MHQIRNILFVDICYLVPFHFSFLLCYVSFRFLVSPFFSFVILSFRIVIFPPHCIFPPLISLPSPLLFFHSLFLVFTSDLSTSSYSVCPLFFLHVFPILTSLSLPSPLFSSSIPYLHFLPIYLLLFSFCHLLFFPLFPILTSLSTPLLISSLLSSLTRSAAILNTHGGTHTLPGIYFSSASTEQLHASTLQRFGACVSRLISLN